MNREGWWSTRYEYAFYFDNFQLETTFNLYDKYYTISILLDLIKVGFYSFIISKESVLVQIYYYQHALCFKIIKMKYKVQHCLVFGIECFLKGKVVGKKDCLLEKSN